MKQMEVTEKQIGESTFYIKPFPAFTAVNISGELAAILSPAAGRRCCPGWRRLQ